MGKTRLAVEAVGRYCEETENDHAYWVNLQATSAIPSLLPAIAQALHLPEHNDSLAQLQQFLSSAESLLVLDNFEQLHSRAHELVPLLAGVPALKCIVTSRVALQLAEEWIIPVRGLAYSPPENTNMAESVALCEAGALFVDRVQRFRPGYAPTQVDIPHIQQICALVEGVPLALELAAAWTRSSDIAAIAREIEHGHSDILTSDRQNVAERHRSMEAVFHHSLALLDAPARAALARLSIFRGGFRRDTAWVVADATVATLTQLVDHSLLAWQADGRYHMHELVRQYAEVLLDKTPDQAHATRGRHAAAMMEMLERYMPALLGARQIEAANAIAEDVENIRRAWHWLVDAQDFAALENAIEPLSLFFHLKSRYQEAAQLFEHALSRFNAFQKQAKLETVPPTQAEQSTRLLLLTELAWMSIRLGDFPRAESLLQECIDLYAVLERLPLPGLGTDPRLGMSTLVGIRGEYERARALAEEACTVAGRQGHVHNEMLGRYQLATLAYAQGDWTGAHKAAAAAYSLSRTQGDRWFMAYCVNELGRSAQALGAYTEAQRHYTESFHLRELFQDAEGMGLALTHLGNLAVEQLEPDAAEHCFQRAETLYASVLDRGGRANVQLGLARVALLREAIPAIVTHLQAALETAVEIGHITLQIECLSVLAALQSRRGNSAHAYQLRKFIAGHPATGYSTRMLAQSQLRAEHGHAEESTVKTDEIYLEQVVLRALRELETFEIRTLRESPSSLVPVRSAPESALLVAREDTPDTHNSPLVETLTARETEVLHLIAQGLSNQEIAAQLQVVLGTVKVHTNNLYGKLGVKSRVQAVKRARELGLLSHT